QTLFVFALSGCSLALQTGGTIATEAPPAPSHPRLKLRERVKQCEPHPMSLLENSSVCPQKADPCDAIRTFAYGLNAEMAVRPVWAARQGAGLRKGRRFLHGR